jgi:hypothetical protein
MKRNVFVALILPLALTCPAIFAQSESISGEVMKACSPPEKPEIPNGRTASEDDMLAAQRQLKSYLADGEAYTACLKELERGWGDASTEERRAVIVIFHNRMVDEMHATGDMFNQAVRAYKGRPGN